MKTKKLFLIAAMLLASMCTFAQSESNEPLKGDVNGDGKVDVADITAIVAIIMNYTSQTTYYWYVGTTNPMNISDISPIVNDNTSMGWRLIGSSIPAYTMNSPLWDGQINEIVFDNYDDIDAYIALPNTTIKVRDGFGNDVTGQLKYLGTKTINNVTYTIYQNTLGGAMSYSLDLLVY